MKDGAGRTLAAALLVAAAMPAATARGANEVVGSQTDTSGGPATGWATQRWPMHGQRGDQRSRITEDFTTAQFRTSGGTTSWPPVTWGGVGRGIWGEITSAYVSALSRVGPHGIYSFLFDDFMFIGVTTAAMQSYAGFLGYPYSSMVIRASNCGEYVGSSITMADPLVEEAETDLGKVPIGFFHIFGLTDCSQMERRTFITGLLQAKITTGPPTPIILALETTDSQSTYPLGGLPSYSPVVHNGVIFAAVRRPGPVYVNGVLVDDHIQAAGLLHAFTAGSVEEPLGYKWQAALQIGSGDTGPLPKGQEPPPAGERYWPTTPPAVRDDLLVIGCEGWSDDFSWGYRRELPVGYALIAYDAETGAQRWAYKVGAAIMPTPSITEDLVVFGTSDGRALAIDHSGNLKWQTQWADRVTYRSLPYSTPQQFSQASLFGPAIDQSENFAYFGGSDGRVHKFALSVGTRTSSELLALFREPGRYDANGLQIIRPVRISSSPAIYKNKMLLVKYHTNTQGSSENGSFLAVLNLPDLAFDPGIRNSPGVSLDPDQAVFRGGGTWGAVSLNGVSGLMGYDTLNQISFISNAGSGIFFNWGDETDDGGVSLADGFAMATDGAGNFVLIPSNEPYRSPVGSGLVKPVPPTPGPEVPPGPPALGPVEAFPNPFMPARAKGGTFKFRNLPMGSRIEIYTLAFERVKSLTESNYRAEWNATNEAGQPVATGVYLYKVFFPDDRPPLTGRVALTR